jgi:RecB family exonuclease
VEDVVDAEFSTKYNQLQGTDVLTGEVIKTMVVKILKEDIKSTPFLFVQSEGKFNTTVDIGSMEINLVGIFDRLDQVNGTYRIIDYKTGNVELSCKGIIELFMSPKKKTLFQLHFYKLLYESVHPDRTARAGFYAVRQMKEGVSFPKNGIDSDNMQEFRTRLVELLKEIYNTEVPFQQTHDLSRCQYCPYTQLCKR